VASATPTAAGTFTAPAVPATSIGGAAPTTGGGVGGGISTEEALRAATALGGLGALDQPPKDETRRIEGAGGPTARPSPLVGGAGASPREQALALRALLFGSGAVAPSPVGGRAPFEVR
jgi:hypothetical protein